MSSVLSMFPMFMILSWVYTSSMIVKNIVFEKEQRLKETMRILGLSNSLLWLGWFLDSFIFLSFACCFLAVVLVVRKKYFYFLILIFYGWIWLYYHIGNLSRK